MSDQNENQTSTSSETPEGTPPEGTSEEQQQTPEGEQQTPEGEAEPKDGEGEPKSKLSHEDALKELTRVRAEAANYRTRLREAEDGLKAAKTPEEFAAATEALAARNAELERELLVSRVASTHKLNDDLTATLKALHGLSPDELEAHATRLAKYMPPEEEPPPAHLSGGLDPDSQDDGPVDPRALAKRYGRGRSK